MDKIEKIIERKIKHRMEAISNMGLENTEMDSDLQEIVSTIRETRNKSVLTLYFPIYDNRRIIAFIKKALRKIFLIIYGWCFETNFQIQTSYNKSVLDMFEMIDKYVEKKFEYFRRQLENQNSEIKKLKEIVQQAEKAKSVTKNENQVENNQLISSHMEETDTSYEIDYFAFENKFRGSREQVKEIQKDFIKFFHNKKGKIFDIGCGRGEFLELLNERKIDAIGIDIYQPFVSFCNDLGMQVVCEDALTVLKRQSDNSIGGIMMSHVVEHLEPSYIIRLIKVAFEKLEKGGCFVIQTPNPQALFTYIDFYVDITHVKPVHYSALEFLFEMSGYERIERFNPPKTKFHDCVTQLYEDKSCINLEEFNYGMNNLNEYLTGYQDYAIVAYK